MIVERAVARVPAGFGRHHRSPRASRYGSYVSPCRRRPSGTIGASLVEFIVVAPVMLMMLLGMIQCGMLQ